jgi:murein DD-endopeptidase MepM/ murein hydrolase activator NlpD
MMAGLLIGGVQLWAASGDTLTTDDASFAAARDEFKTVSDDIAKNAERSLELERRLQVAEKKVHDAKVKVEELQSQKNSIRDTIKERKALLKALTEQIDVLKSDDDVRQATIEDQKSALMSYARLMSLRNDVDVGSGPVAGGVVLRRLLRGSLGDEVDADLHTEALLKARESLIEDLALSMTESEKAHLRLQEVADVLSGEIAALTDEYNGLHAAALDGIDAVAASVTQRELTEQELTMIRQAMQEASAQVMVLQRSMLDIRDRLRAYKEQQASKNLAAIDAKLADAAVQQKSIDAKRADLLAVKQDALDAYNAGRAARNSDRKSYRDAQETALMIKNLTEELALLSGTGATEENRARFTARIEVEQDRLTYLRDGWPMQFVDAYFAKRTRAEKATASLNALEVDAASLAATVLDLQSQRAAAVDDVERAKKFEQDLSLPVFTGKPLMWPIKGRITAVFHDANYEARFHVPHQGIDIAAMQSTPIYSAGDGIVFKVKDGGATGYSYVLIGHDDGYSTLYGHLSTMLVVPGQLVGAGQVIGLSGGTPGTPGAGWMTTGPHLHFEVHKDGKYINPTSVLP